MKFKKQKHGYLQLEIEYLSSAFKQCTKGKVAKQPNFCEELVPINKL